MNLTFVDQQGKVIKAWIHWIERFATGKTKLFNDDPMHALQQEP